MVERSISKDSPHYEWDRESPGWLYRRAQSGEDILPEDVARVLECNPALLPDDIVRDLAVRGLRCELKGTRGRKPMNPIIIWRIMARYEDLVEEQLASAGFVRRRGLAPAARGPSGMERIHEVIAKEFRLGGPHNVRNLISSLKNPKKRVRARGRPG